MVITPNYGLFPPRGGGMIRRFHLIQELAREHEVHAIISQAEDELHQPKDGYKFPESPKVYSMAQSSPPRTIFDHLPHRIGPALQYRWLQRSWRGPTNSDVLNTHHLIREILEDNEIDAVIFGDLSSMLSASLVKRLSPRSVRILNADNIDHHLLAQELQSHDGSESERKLLQESYIRTRWYESHLEQHVDAFFACSNDDREVLESLNGARTRGFTIPNGVDTSARPFDTSLHKSECREIIFCGTLSYPPNRDGLFWFHEKIWPLIIRRHPDARLVVIGWGSKKEYFSEVCADPTVKFIGQVQDSIPYYHRTGIAVVPLRIGSGTRLKILDSMSLGNPVVSTRTGAGGMGAVDGEHLLLMDTPTHFAEAIERLLCNPELFERIRRSARRFVERQYDWRVIGQTMNKALNSLISKSDYTFGYAGSRKPKAIR
jgi:polysaccharide biosynthesis protein PslH